MEKNTHWASRLCCIGLVAGTLVLVGAPVFADPPDRYNQNDHRDYRDDRRDERRTDRRDDRRDDRREDRRDNRRDDRREIRVDRDRRYDPRERYRGHYRDYRRPPHVIYRGVARTAPHNRVRWYRDVVIVRPHGHWYSGYAHYHHDNDAYRWLAFTAITLGILDFLNEAQQREHEAAQIAATTAPIGERIIWREGAASGVVIATREGTSTSGRYCREFQQEVSIGGKSEQAYGTACRNPDGSWEVISVDGP